MVEQKRAKAKMRARQEIFEKSITDKIATLEAKWHRASERTEELIVKVAAEKVAVENKAVEKKEKRNKSINKISVTAKLSCNNFMTL